MRSRFWVLLVLVLLTAMVSVQATYACRGNASVSEEPVSSAGGKLSSDSDGGDPDGVGLDCPGQGLDLPGGGHRSDPSHPAPGGWNPLEMLHLVHATVHYLVR